MCIRGKNKPIVEERRQKIIDRFANKNNVFSKLILPLNFKTAAFLNKGLI